jgi:putative membrane protein
MRLQGEIPMSNETGPANKSDEPLPTANPVGQYLVYFAAERTLMAWIRAALGLMALGFVIDRFGLVVRTMTPHAGPVVQSSTMSFVAGAGLVVVGALLAAVAAVRYAHFLRRYRQSGDIHPGYGLEPALFFTVVVGLMGALIAGYLMSVGL